MPELDRPKPNGVSAGILLMDWSTEARASLTMLVTSAEVFLGVDAGAAVEVPEVLGAPKPPNVKGDEAGAAVDDPVPKEGVKPAPAGVVEVVLGLPSENDPAAGMLNVGGLGGATGFGGDALVGASKVPGAGKFSAAAFLPSGLHPFLSAVSSRYRAYCLPRLGRISVKSVNGSSWVSLAINDDIEILRPRRAV